MAANRRPIALAAAVATVAAVGATAFALPATAAEAPAGPPAQIKLKDGTLDWGFKESFRTYLASPFSGGRITVAGGAEQAANNGVFTFVDGVGTYDMKTHGTQTGFKGSVHFTAHEGVLDVTLSDLKVGTAGKAGAITADVRSKPMGSKEFVVQDDVELAALDLSAVKPGQGAGGAMVFKDIPATLTKAGSTAFNGQYKEGDKLDPATLSVVADRGGEPTKPPVDPTKPPVDPTRPPVDPTKPPLDPTKPPLDPTKPPLDPTAPPISDPGQAKPPVGPPAGAEQGAVVDGNLDWGVLGRFRDYVTGPIAHGKVELSGGAVKSGVGFRFPKGKGSFDAEKQNLSAAFAGKVRFVGHEEGGEYTLDLNFSAFKVEVKGGRGTLVADVSTKDRATKKVETFKALTIADLTPAGELSVVDGVVKLAGVPAKLTAGGSKAFGGMYKAGQELDALTVAVSVEEGARLPGGSAGGAGTAGGSTGGAGTTGGGSVGGGLGGGSVGGNLAATGASAPSGVLVGAAGALAVAGGAVVFAARKRRVQG
ncbi:HtaA domain-containing protein [Streptomyces sp. NPDC048442]|uniref:HtaA domain-containing protein n=1 Tax=Streptomyces sp. NPDC048442 TaxID=3154823 RepID=UPI0034355739